MLAISPPSIFPKEYLGWRSSLQWRLSSPELAQYRVAFLDPLAWNWRQISVSKVLAVGSLSLQSSKRVGGRAKAFPNLVTHPTFLWLGLRQKVPLFALL